MFSCDLYASRSSFFCLHSTTIKQQQTHHNIRSFLLLLSVPYTRQNNKHNTRLMLFGWSNKVWWICFDFCWARLNKAWLIVRLWQYHIRFVGFGSLWCTSCSRILFDQGISISVLMSSLFVYKLPRMNYSIINMFVSFNKRLHEELVNINLSRKNYKFACHLQ